MPIVFSDGTPLKAFPPEPEPESTSTTRRVASMVPRIGMPLLGGVLGAAAGAPAGPPGMLAGGAAGAAVGGGAGELLGQDVEGMERNYPLAGVEAFLSAIPGGFFGKASTVGRTMLRRGGEGAVMGATGYVPRALARGEDPSLQGAALDTATGFGVGAGFGGIEGSFTRGGADVGFTSPAQRGARRIRGSGRGDAPAPGPVPEAPIPDGPPDVGQIVPDQPTRPRGTILRVDPEGNRIDPELPPGAVPPVEPPPVPPAPDSGPTEQALAQPAQPRNPLNPASPEAVARRIQGMTDDAPAVPPIQPRDIERYQRIQQRPVGNEIAVRGTANPNEPYRMRWRIVDLDDVDLNDPRVQPRNRADRAASEAQINKIAKDPRADEHMAGNDLVYAGTPIIAPDGLPEGGNGRFGGYRRARDSNPEGWARFQARQRELAGIAGFRPEDFDGIDNPLIVRERISPVRDRLAFADDTNARPQAAMSAAENARRDAQRIPDGVLEALQVGDSQTLDQALASGTNRQAVRGFLATLPKNEAGALVDADGQISQEGVRRMKAALLGKAFPGESGSRLIRSMTESTDSGVKQAEAGIAGAMGRLAKVRPVLAEYPEADLSDDLAWAVNKLAQIRSEGGSVDDFLRQSTMFTSDRTQRRDVLLDFIGKAKSAKKIREAIKGYADRVGRLPSKSQGSLLGGGAQQVDTMPMLESAIAEAGTPAAAAGQRSLLGEESGGIEPPRILRRILEWIADEDNARTPTAPVTEVPPDPGPIPKSRRQTLGQMGLEEAGNLPAPPAAVDILDEFGNPIPRTGALSSDDPARLAPSLLDDVRDEDSLLNFKNRIAQAKAVDVEYARRGVRAQDETLRDARGLAAELADRLNEDVAETVSPPGDAVAHEIVPMKIEPERMRAREDEG